MQPFLEWIAEKGGAERPWLILGKGPSFERRDRLDLSGFETLGLNHVVREMRVRVAHAIDLDVIDQVGEAIAERADALVMPWVPHVRCGAARAWWTGCPVTLSDENLAQIAARHPVLRRLEVEGRLLWYNLSTARIVRDGSPIVPVRYFSAEAALNLLAAAGVRTVRSLGVDGGAGYSREFHDLNGVTRLANGRTSFDAQFREIARTLSRTSISYAPLDVDTPVRVYVAATDAQMLAVRVLEYSIRKHASMDVEVRAIHQANVRIPVPADARNRPRTPFSFQRFLIPALTGFAGRAIYLDSDMQVFRDIRPVWTLPFGDADVLTTRSVAGLARRPQFSVLLLDCARLQWDIDEIVRALDAGRLTYEALMYDLAIASRVADRIPAAWNSLEAYAERETALLHYTDMSTQPWVSKANPRGYLWMRDLFEAIDKNVISYDEVKAHVTAGHVRPSLLYQIDHRLEDSLLLPAQGARLDAGFSPAWTTLNRSRGSAWRRALRVAAAVPRQAARTAVRHADDRRTPA